MAEENFTDGTAPKGSTTGSVHFESVPQRNIFEGSEESHGAILCGRATARVDIALGAIQTICAILHQREMDAEYVDDEDGVAIRLNHNVAMGLLNAVAVCADYAQNMASGGMNFGTQAPHGTPGYALIEKAIAEVSHG